MKFKIFKQIPKIIYGKGSLLRFRELMPENARKGLVIVDTKVVSKILKMLFEDIHIKLIDFNATEGEPYTWQVDEIVNQLSNHDQLDFIIGIGGGSTMDIAKKCIYLHKK